MFVPPPPRTAAVLSVVFLSSDMYSWWSSKPKLWWRSCGWGGGWGLKAYSCFWHQATRMAQLDAARLSVPVRFLQT